MGDSIKRHHKKMTEFTKERVLDPRGAGTGISGDEAEGIRTKTHQLTEKPFRKGTTSAARDAKQMALKQQQMDKIAIAQTEDEMARRRAGAGGKSGRRSLIASSPSGLAQTLGGA